MKTDKKTTKQHTRVFNRLKGKPGHKIDALFHETHEQVFAKTDCLTCANCCKTTSPIFIDQDVTRISQHLRMTQSEFAKKYLKIDEEGDYVLRSAPCSFLMDDNRCAIYDKRPRACREYPHTNRKNMMGIKDLTITNASICPAVSEILEKIESKLPA